MADTELLGVVLALRADVTDLKAKFSQAESSARAAGTKMSDAFKGVALGLGAIGTAFMIFKKGQALMQGAIQAAQKQEFAQRKLQSALGYTSTALLQQASALQASTTFGDEAIVEAQALVGAFIKEESQIKRLMPLILDFAAAKGIDLKSAADLVTKSIASGTNALARHGIKITESKDKGERLESVIKGLDKAFGGMAESIAQTPSGILEQQKNLLDDMAESVGMELIPFQIEWNKLLLETLQGWGWIYTRIKKTLSWADLAKQREITWHEQMRDDAFATAAQLQRTIDKVKELGREGNKTVQLEVGGKQEVLTIDKAIAKLEQDRRIALRTAGGEAKMTGALISPTVAGGKKTTPTTPEVDPEAAATKQKAALQLQIAEIEAALVSYSAELNLALTQIDAQYASSSVSIQQYFASKRAIIEEQASAEISTKKELALLEQDAAKFTTMSANIDKLKIDAQIKKIELDKEEADALKALSVQQMENAQTVAGIQARVDSAGIQTYRERLDEELAALAAKHEEELRRLREHGTAVELIKSATRAQTQETVLAEQQAQVAYLQNSLSVINDVVGQISGIYDQYYAKVVQEEKQKMEAQISAAQAAGASESQLESLRKSLSAQANARAKKAWEKQKKADLASAVIGTALAVVNALQTKPFYVGLIMALLAGAAGAVQIATIAGQSYPGMATGGLVSQGTTGTADDVHARLSRGEYVTPAKSVSYYGPEVMEALRRRSVPKELFSGIGASGIRRGAVSFAEGGMVTAQPGQGEKPVTIVNFLDPAIMDRYINSIEGERAIVNVINRRSYEVSKALGG